MNQIRIRASSGRPRLRVLWFGAALAVLFGLCVASVTIGVREVSWADIGAALAGESDTIAEAAVLKRIPRTVMALLAGAALGLAGVLLQGISRNPLADSGILGINSGASLAVVTSIAWFGLAESHAYVWTAVAGAALTAVFVYAVASLGAGGPTPLKLALAGTATSIAFASFINGVILGRNDIAGAATSWMIGGVGGVTFDRVVLVLPFLAAGLLISLVSARKLNSIALGDEVAAGLGENVVVARVLAATGAVLLCGATTAVCGPIAFVGLAVPHFCRLLVGIDHRWLLPFSAVAGACLLIAADLIGRMVARPSEMDVGIVTAFVGVPIFIWIVRRKKVREL